MCDTLFQLARLLDVFVFFYIGHTLLHARSCTKRMANTCCIMFILIFQPEHLKQIIIISSTTSQIKAQCKLFKFYFQQLVSF